MEINISNINIKYKINLELGKTPKTKATTADGKFSFYDWGEDYKPENDWFVRFAKHNLLSGRNEKRNEDKIRN